jgi:hypothetical protein
MAIVINGSGTLSGLAVGGLPDGTVDAGTLATDSVDSAELIDGAVDNSHMAAMAASKLTGTVATARMPAGTVLQVVSAERRTHLSVTADNTTDWITLTITPTSSSSKIKLSVMGGSSNDNGNNFSMLLLHRDSTNIAYGNSVGAATPCWIDIGCRGSGQGDAYIYQQKPFSGVYIDSPNTTSAITYKAKVRNRTNGTLYLGRTANVNAGDGNRTTTMGMLIAEEIGA